MADAYLTPPSQASLGACIDRVARLDTSGDVTLDQVVRALGPTGALPLLMILGAALVSPLSGVPLFTSVVGICIAFGAVKLLAGHTRIRLPAVLARRHVPGARIDRATGFLHRGARVIDGMTRSGRLGWLAGSAARWVVGGLMLACGLAMPMLELVPFSSSILGGAVLLMALGLLAHDGLLVLLGLAAMSLAASLVITLVSAVAG